MPGGSYLPDIFKKAADLFKRILDFCRSKKKYVIIGGIGILLIVCAVIISICVISKYQKSKIKYEYIALNYPAVTEKKNEVVMNELVEFIDASEEEPEEELPDPEALNAEWGELTGTDFLAFKADYPETVGWIFFENEDTSYPIMFSGDNEKYLHTAYDGTYLFAGAIFLDEESSTDFSDPHSLIYGHNMRDGSMFGKLRNYLNEPDYYEDHQYFMIFNGEKILKYRVFAYGIIPDSSIIYWTFGPNPDNMETLVDTIMAESRIKPEDIDVSASDTIVTLSTCSAESDKREIVCGILTDD